MNFSWQPSVPEPPQHLHPSVDSLVDDDRLASLLINVMIHAKVGCNSVHNHSVVGRHLWVLDVESPGETTHTHSSDCKLREIFCPEFSSTNNSRLVLYEQQTILFQSCQKLAISIKQRKLLSSPSVYQTQKRV